MALLNTIGAVICAAYALWVCYLALMNVYRVKREGKLKRVQLVLASPLLIVGGVLDVAFNLIVGTVLLLDTPQEWTLSARLARLNNGDTGWRGRIAEKVGTYLLHDFDPTWNHYD
jgi:hypothetical protein